MATSPLSKVMDHLRMTLGEQEEMALPDSQLLEQFITRRDQTAFQIIARRHGPMVMGTCLRVVRNRQDAEDAYQTAFLVLARKARTIAPREFLAKWLYGVAFKTALKVQAATAKRRSREKQVSTMPERALTEQARWIDLLPYLDQELTRLPDKYRLPIILCDLEGKTHKKAAQLLACSEKTLSTRLSRGRALLAKRLSRHGLAVSGASLATLLAQNAISASVPPGLVIATAKAACLFAAGEGVVTGAVSATVVALTEGMLKGMLLTKLKIMASAVLFLGFLGVGVGTYVRGNGQHNSFLANEQTVKSHGNNSQDINYATVSELKEMLLATDQYGDPLPKGAVARIGTTRFWPDDYSYSSRLIAYAPDGKQLVSSGGKAVCFLDVKTGKEMRRLEIQGHEFQSFNFSPDGKTLATLGFQNETMTNEVRLWDAVTLKELRRISETLVRTPNGSDPVVSATFTADGKNLVVAKSDRIRMWDLASWQEKTSLIIGIHYFRCFLPDGKTLISASFADGIRWWDTATSKEIRRQDKFQIQHPKDVAISLDGKRLAALEKTNLLHLLNAATGEETGLIAFDEKEDLLFSFTPDSQTLVCCKGLLRGQERSETVFFTADTGRELRRWRMGASEWGNMAFAPDGKTLANRSSNYINIRDTRSGQLLNEVPKVPETILSVHFDQESNSLIACLRDGQISAWNPLTGKQLRPFQTPPKEIGKPQFAYRRATGFTPDGKTAALVDEKGDLYVWESATGKIMCRIENQSSKGGYATFSPDGKSLAVEDKDQGLGLWDVVSGQLIRVLPTKYCNRVFSPDGRVLATASRKDNYSLYLWDAATGKEIRQLLWKDGLPADGLTFSSDGKCLISIHSGFHMSPPSGKSCMRIWDWASGRELRSFSPVFHSPWLVNPAISPDGRTLCTVNAAGGTISLYELVTGKRRVVFTGHRSLVFSLVFSQDGRLLATGSDDHTALVWDLTGISPDGKLVLRDIQAEELQRLWADLGDSDAAKAYRALWAMVAAQRQSVPFLAKLLHPVLAPDDKQVARLIQELGSEEFKVRIQASTELEQLGKLAEPALSKALAGKPSLELRKRVDLLLDKSFAKPLSTEQVLFLRAVEMLEQVGTPEAQAVLEILARGAPGACETEEAKMSLERLARRVVKLRRL